MRRRDLLLLLLSCITDTPSSSLHRESYSGNMHFMPMLHV
jgi:hypothetical protein